MKIDEYWALMAAYRSGCVFCDISPLLVVHRTENFGVCLDPAPLRPGHLMVFSTDHHGCAGEVPPEHQAELAALHDDLLRRMVADHGAVTVYEHGRAGHCLSHGPEDRFCHHFHSHFVPGDHNVEKELSERFVTVRLESHRDVADAFDKYGEYVYYERSEGDRLFFVADSGEMEPHLMRTLISAAIGQPELADWSKYSSPDLLVAGLAGLRESKGNPAEVHLARK
ncbi:HIT family protein [Kribbella speibonae]|uniref:Cwf19-like C-terminal domain-containing protein n=1 Tax=Kribbella speibonae TaxID=1572660 RepID=A0A4V2M529_9ACTN|nr:hypothetical protein [Kribbella speibonae]TCC23721.1 hypothetical protein E0H58_18370 [Kribbella speibonae]TCC38232.1 hypothetical protein E0H92_17460 [Kribbella speibonae]